MSNRINSIPFDVVLFLCVCIICIVGIIGGCWYSTGTYFVKTITVEKSFQNISGKSNQYMVCDTENNSYEVSDSLWNLHFSSTDLWNTIKEGHTYLIKGYGWRNHFWSMYPNIISAQEKK